MSELREFYQGLVKRDLNDLEWLLHRLKCEYGLNPSDLLDEKIDIVQEFIDGKHGAFKDA